MSVKVKSAPWLPNREHLERQYGEFMPSFETLLERLDSHLKSCITVPSANFKGRVKGFNSYYRKLLRTMSADGVKNEEFPVITDIIGIRIVCAFLQDLVQVEKNLQDCFTVLEVERKGADRTFREFGYESTHILLAIPRELKEGLSLPRDLIFEIQVRTILQDAWAEVEHELVSACLARCPGSYSRCCLN
ncbi:MAG TPA: RelA/SpoT domain-containing protein, partial [Treponemataceae bacterium]|nr:RelA/SpoT domain-containing protein [Treponemataceae bacterium]